MMRMIIVWSMHGKGRKRTKWLIRISHNLVSVSCPHLCWCSLSLRTWLHRRHRNPYPSPPPLHPHYSRCRSYPQPPPPIPNSVAHRHPVAVPSSLASHHCTTTSPAGHAIAPPSHPSLFNFFNNFDFWWIKMIFLPECIKIAMTFLDWIPVCSSP